MKRFTETNKWRDPWFRRLSSPAKQLWGYLLDNCDCIGLVEIDLKLTSSDVGQKITQEHIRELGDRLQDVGNGRYFLPKFINFQYGDLSDKCPAHRPVIRQVLQRGLFKDGIAYRYPSVTLSSQVVENQGNEYPIDRVAIPYRKGMDIDIEKERKEEGGTGGNVEIKHNRFEKPSLETVKLQAAKIGLPDIEAEKFYAFYESKGWVVGKAQMKSWCGALSGWKLRWQESPHIAPVNGEQTPSLWEKETERLRRETGC